MPTLDWIGKEAVENHHNQVPFRLLKRNNKLSFGEPDSGNLLVQGDNLEALKALLPYYAGQVKCIYIDPPYNTGNENWVYNDNVNSPEMKEWLGKVVGKEGEDLSRSDKWLCMMYPRLALLKQFLRDDGAIFVSIDNNEVHHLKTLMDEIFGANNFIEQFIWRSRLGKGGTANQTATIHEYIICYGKKANLVVFRRDERIHENRRERLRQWGQGDRQEDRPSMCFPIKTNSGVEVWPVKPDGTMGRWRVGKKTMGKLLDENFIEFETLSDGRIEAYRLFPEGHTTYSAIDSILSKDVGTTADGSKLLKTIFENNSFDYPKPIELLSHFIDLLCSKNDLILDSFAGSGTTGHTVLKMNKQDGGNRKFVLVEMIPDICNKITYSRLKSAIEGYNGNEGLGSGFSYCELGQTLFNAEGQIRDEVSYNDLARHIYFCETGEPLPKTPRHETPLLGVHKEAAIYLLYNGILKDKTVNGGNVLTSKVLACLPKFDGKKVIYGTACRLSEKGLRGEQVIFRQTPYEIRIS